MTISFDPKSVKRERLARAIRDLGYRVSAASADASPAKKLLEAPIGEASPAFLRDARDAARQAGQLLVVGFTATWCAACKELKKETLESDVVAPLWKRAKLVYVDLDEHPELGKAFLVGAIPDVLFVAPDGRIVDRLREFESPDAFKDRLSRLLSK